MAIVLAAAGFLTLTGCGNENADNSDYLIYYSNSTDDDVVYLGYSMPDKDKKTTNEIVEELLYKLFDEEQEDGIHYSPLPSKVVFNGYKVEEEIVTLDFGNGYLNMTNVQELILKAGVVLTLAQVEGITSVKFTVDGQPITDTDGNEVGIMNSSQYVNLILSDEGLLKQETTLKVYFANAQGTKLVPSTYNFTLDNKNQSLEEYILQQLIAGPGESAGVRTLDSQVELIGVTTSKGTCYVNFGENFLEQSINVTDDIMIYSIVNSLCQLVYVTNVQFLVNGESNVTLHKTFDLTQPISRNMDYVEEIPNK